MSMRPVPPLIAEELNDFASSIQESCPEWFTYFSALLAYVSNVEGECLSLRSTVSSLQEQVQQHAGVIAYQEKKLQEGKDEIQRILLTYPSPVTTPASDNTSVRVVPTAITRTLSSTVSESSRLSEKLPDPDKFEGDRSDLRRFISQIHEKLITNFDRFPTPQSRMSYVTNRLKGKPYSQVLPYIKKGVCDLPDYTDILDLLERAFGDPNRIQNARRDLFSLRQRNSDFGTFFAEFQRLALEGNVSEETLPTLLEQAISRELQGMLLHSQPPSREYHTFARFLQELENRRRQYESIPTQSSRSYAAATSSARAPERTTTRIAVTTPITSSRPAPVTISTTEPMDLSRQRPIPPLSQSRKETGACFRCGSMDHRIRDCPLPDNRPKNFRSATRSPTTSPLSSPSRGRSLLSSRSPSPPSGVSVKGMSLGLVATRL